MVGVGVLGMRLLRVVLVLLFLAVGDLLRVVFLVVLGAAFLHVSFKKL